MLPRREFGISCKKLSEQDPQTLVAFLPAKYTERERERERDRERESLNKVALKDS
jgi:hypothetical protein